MDEADAKLLALCEDVVRVLKGLRGDKPYYGTPCRTCLEMKTKRLLDALRGRNDAET